MRKNLENSYSNPRGRDDRSAERIRGEWFLVQRTGTVAFKLNPHSLIVIGSELCDINIQSPSVEKRHAVMCFDPNSGSFSVKDLNSTNGTFLNNRRLSSDRAEKLMNMDLLRFGNDSNLYETRLGTSAGPEIQENDQNVTYFSQQNSVDFPYGGTRTGSGGSQSPHVMQQSGGARGSSLYGSRVSSPSLTLDSGRGSSSTPSSPAKEMSPGPVSTPKNNLLYSPNLSRKMTKSAEPSKRHEYAASFSRNNSEERVSPFSRRDSLEKMKVIGDCGIRDSNKSAVIGDLDDLNVPNEVFDKQMEIIEPQEEIKERVLSPTCSKQEETFYSGPRSLDDVGTALYAPTSATPLYGTPNWWPQGDKEDDDQNSACKDLDELSNDEKNSDSRPSHFMDLEPVSLTSEQSMDSDTSVDKKKVSPMAFTIDFDDGPKKFGISDSISKFAPRHRRNLSLTKTEETVTARRNSETPIDSNSKKDITPLTALNNKSVNESDCGLNGKPNVSKNLSSRTVKNNTTAKLFPTCSSDNKCELVEINKNSLSSKKSEKEVVMRKPKLSTSLFSSRPKSITSMEQISSVAASSSKNELARKLQQTTTTKTISKPENKSSKGIHKVQDVDKDVDDASSETGTYTIDKPEPAVEKARENIAKMLGVKASDMEISEETDVNSSAPEWVREWAEAASIQHKKIKDQNPLTDTQLFLQETENVVSAMQERVTRNLSNNNSSHNSDSDDEATLSNSSPKKLMGRFKRPAVINSRKPDGASPTPLPRREASVLSDSGYQVGYQSDSSNEGMKEYKNIGAVKMNKAFNIRRGRVPGIGYDSDGCALGRQILTTPVRGTSPRPNGSMCSSNGMPPIIPKNAFSRNDGGRFSLRMSKSKTPVFQMPPPMAVPLRTTPKTGTSGAAAKILDQNANRRQSHTPTTSTPTLQTSNPNSRKPPTGCRSNSTLTAKEVELANWRRRKTYDPMRAAAEGRKKRGTSSAIEDIVVDTPTELSKHSASYMSKSMSFQMENTFPPKGHSEEEDMIYVVDEVDSSHSNSPIHIPMNPRSHSSHEDSNYYGASHSHSSLRPKNKLEALDNLVIATIHSLSNKVRASSRQLLEKMQIQHVDNENGALLEEMVSQLKELEISNSNSSPNKSPSRELSGTLKNLKKLEQVILVLDRVLCDDSGSDANN